jgi:hypothetical protein
LSPDQTVEDVLKLEAATAFGVGKVLGLTGAVLNFLLLS